MPQPITSLRAGIIGTGFIGPAHIEALKRLGVQVYAPSWTMIGRRSWPTNGVCPTPSPTSITRKLVTHPEVDVVHIASPNKLHAAARDGRPQGREARDLREAAGDDLEGDGAVGETRRGAAERRSSR